MILRNQNLNSSSFLKIENTIFCEIIGDDSNDFFRIEGANILIIFEHLQISLVGFYSSLFYINNKNGKFSINSSLFLQNYLYQNILSLNFLYSANISNTMFQYTNNLNDNTFFQGGGNIILQDCIMKFIENLEIYYSFSSKTTFGVKIVDVYQNKMNMDAYVNIILKFFTYTKKKRFFFQKLKLCIIFYFTETQ